MRVVATAGHVDHGKSTLILALTGTDPDRFPEEKARGLTIDLGFAFMALDGLAAGAPGAAGAVVDAAPGTAGAVVDAAPGTAGAVVDAAPGTAGADVVGFVDVPGHVRFVKNMLAGVGAVETAMLVVAANEGWMPQTEEHVRILELLGIEHGLIALTKADLVDDETLEIAQLELADRLAGSRLEAWPIVVVDGVSGRGLDEVRTTLAAVLAAAPAAHDAHRARLWVDRSFAARGAGTIVTGTLAHGALAIDDEVVVHPGARRARVRGIESNHERLSSVAPGARVALNLAGVDHTEIGRGAAVVAPNAWMATTAFDARVLTTGDQPLPRRANLALHAGAGEWPARWRLLDADGRFARVRLATPLPLAPGDRVVLRSTGRRATIGGAEVLDVAPARRTADALARITLPREERAVAARPFADTAEVVRLAGLDPTTAARELSKSPTLVAVGGGWTTRERLASLTTAARGAVTEHHRRAPDEPGIDLATLAARLAIEPARVRAVLAGAPDLVVEHDVVRHRDHAGRASQTDAGRRLLDALEATPFAPPAPAAVGAEARLVRLLQREGLVVELDGVAFATRALDEARTLVVQALAARGSLTVADARDLLGSTRKFVLPILNRLDSEGVTRRRGDDRLPGPRAGRDGSTDREPA